MLHFDSDYMRGAHPEVMKRLMETNMEQTPGYGTDCHTANAERLILDACGLKEGFTGKGYELYIDSPTNQQFFILPDSKIDKLMQVATFELWGPRSGKETPARFVTDWATCQDEVEELIRHL